MESRLCSYPSSPPHTTNACQCGIQIAAALDRPTLSVSVNSVHSRVAVLYTSHVRSISPRALRRPPNVNTIAGDSSLLVTHFLSFFFFFALAAAAAADDDDDVDLVVVAASMAGMAGMIATVISYSGVFIMESCDHVSVIVLYVITSAMIPFGMRSIPPMDNHSCARAPVSWMNALRSVASDLADNGNDGSTDIFGKGRSGGGGAADDDNNGGDTCGGAKISLKCHAIHAAT